MLSAKVESSREKYFHQVSHDTENSPKGRILWVQFAIDLIGDFPSCQRSLRCLNLAPLERRFKSVLQQEPGLSRARALLGAILFFQHKTLEGESKTKKLREAGDCLFEVLNGNSSNFNASYLIANVCLKLCHCVEAEEAEYLTDLAKQYFFVVLQMEPTCEDEWVIFRKAVFEYGMLINNEDNMSESDSGELKKSELDCQYKHLAEAVHNDPTDLQAQYLLGRVCLKYRHYFSGEEYMQYAAEATRCFETIIEAASDYCLIGNALYQNSKLLRGELKMEQLMVAKMVFEGCLSIQPDNPSLYLSLGKTYLAFRSFSANKDQEKHLENQGLKCIAKVFLLEASS
ncbi:tetratricopeptide repeat protein [Simkania negevensis]|uniref:Uncharacterized protein n=1 Tax=Simkania negevensis (strain ATCC VR-1471 / DSM 27360 / Z) TaxID=331113 RepID=F8L731_SIMNZ|nr:hypothetical protein [Simkania negevensis]CCB88546.1 unknown protein [Simkania negevensis Z]